MYSSVALVLMLLTCSAVSGFAINRLVVTHVCWTVVAPYQSRVNSNLDVYVSIVYLWVYFIGFGL